MREWIETWRSRLQDHADSAYERYRGLSYRAKVAVWLFFSFQVTVGLVTLYIGPETIFATLASYAKSLREMPFGWLLIVAGITLSSVPPIVSFYGMLITICGFAYESVFQGWLVGMTGCLVGSAFSFVVCRHFLSKFRHFLEGNKHVDALSRVIDDKGMPLIALVRLAPISFGYSNLLFASIPSVDLPRFLLGTLAITPKLFLHVFTGNRMYKFADPDEREKLDKSGKILNGVSIAVSVALGMGVGLYVWRLTMQHIRAVELREDADDAAEEGLLSEDQAQLNPLGTASEYPPQQQQQHQKQQEPEVSLEEIDRELAAQGGTHEQWEADQEQFSDFDEPDHEPAKAKQSDDRLL